MDYFNMMPPSGNVVGRPFPYNEQSHIFRRERTGEAGWSHSVRPQWSHDTTDEWIIEWLTEAQVEAWIKHHQPAPPLTVDDMLDFMIAFDEWVKRGGDPPLRLAPPDERSPDP